MTNEQQRRNGSEAEAETARSSFEGAEVNVDAIAQGIIDLIPKLEEDTGVNYSTAFAMGMLPAPLMDVLDRELAQGQRAVPRRRRGQRPPAIPIHDQRQAGRQRPHGEPGHGPGESGGLMATVENMRQLLGQTCMVPCGDLMVDCLIKDARQVWNRIDVQVEPVRGEGRQWVSLDRIILAKEQERRENDDGEESR